MMYLRSVVSATLLGVSLFSGQSMAGQPMMSLNTPETVNEGDGSLQVKVQLDEPAKGNVKFKLRVDLQPSWVSNPDDWASFSDIEIPGGGRFINGMIEEGETETSFSLIVVDDEISEYTETLRTNIVWVQRASINERRSYTEIIDNDAEFSLNILHINDHHSHLEANTRADLVIDGVETRVTTGGFPRVVSKFRELESSLDNVLKLHAGDAITGSIYYSLYKGEADAEMMNHVCFDAFALGNHEFDDSDAGLSSFIDYLNADPAVCQTPVLAANVQPALGTPLLPTEDNSLIQPYVIKDIAGEQVGIIGIDIAGKTKNSSSPLDTTEFLDELETAQHYIDTLTSEGINKIILLTHYQYLNDLALAGSLEGVDVIVGGDSHTLLGESFADFGLNPSGPYPTVVENLDGDQACIVHAWQYADVVGQLNVLFDKQGEVIACEGTPHLLIGDTFQQRDATGSRVELESDARQAVLDTIDATDAISMTIPDLDAEATLGFYASEVEILKQTVIGEVTETLCLERIPGQGRSALCPTEATQANGGDIQQLVTKAFLARSFEADVALQNAGGVRVDIPAGPLSINDVYTLLPFANTLVNLQMTGLEIKQVLEEAVANFQDNAGSTGSFPYAAGLRWTLDLSQPFGSRFTDIEIKRKDDLDWTPLGETDVINVVTNSFIAAGRDGYLTFGTVSEEGRVLDTFIDYAQAFIDYTEQDATGIITPESCEDYSTKTFINNSGETQFADPTVGRACE